jgi:DNA (cytosine-5)-methyltransferase 1
MAIRVLDLFCGGGGSSWGALQAGAQIVGGVDADPIAARAYSANFPGAQAFNLRMHGETGARDIGLAGGIDLLLASPECTNHTCARGSRPINEESRETARYVVSFARDLRPRWVVIENVPQMRSWGGYEALLRDLRQLGYRLDAATLDAQHFGVPQQRRRLFIVGDLKQQPSLPPVSAKPRGKVETILDPAGRWPSRPLYREGRARPTLERAERAMAELGRGIPFLIVYYGSDASGGWQRLDRPLRTITTIDRFGLVTWQGDEPMLRMLQVPELMRAMGFGKGYSLDGLGCRRDRIRLLGNGVAPPVMTEIIRTLTGKVAGNPRQESLLPA